MLTQEMRHAIEKTAARHPCILIDKFVAVSFINKVAELKNETPFGLSIRYSLNFVGIWDKKTRMAYASLAGTYFGRRGGLQTAKRKPKKEVLRVRQQESTNKHIKIDKNGQYEFDI